MSIESKLKTELKNHGADFVVFVDVSHLSAEQNKNFPNAILLGIILSQDYLNTVSKTPDYVENLKDNKQIHEDEFHQKEIQTDRLADQIADYLISKGYSAYSQSEDHIDSTGHYNEETKSTPLPHKTIALMAGLGWIGKHNLLVTPDYGSAISMCTVLTDAPLETVSYPPAKSLCGTCCVCQTICSVHAIKGNTWDISTPRDVLVDVYSCTTCLNCLVFCPYTQTYMKKQSS